MSLNGIYRKFRISRTDGRDTPGEKHDGCSYFVLDLDHDPHVWEALRGYARACVKTHPELSQDITRMLTKDNPLEFFRKKLGGDAK